MGAGAAGEPAVRPASWTGHVTGLSKLDDSSMALRARTIPTGMLRFDVEKLPFVLEKGPLVV